MSTEITNYAPPRHMTLDQSIRAWLDEKRADSVRTADAYEDTLKDFRDTLQSAGLDLVVNDLKSEQVMPSNMSTCPQC